MIACRYLVLLSMLTASATVAHAENMMSMKIGMTWPRALLSTGVPTGDAEVNYGIIVDKKIALGITGNFLWNVQSKEERVREASTTRYRIISEQKSFMFPVMGFFHIDPVPDLIVHPVARFQIGYNSMIYSYNQAADSAGATSSTVSPYFFGLIMKAGVDALYDIGEHSALFLGLEYRWANTKTVSNDADLFDKRNMGGIGLCAGFRVIL
ncbi:MAG: hypothetical protein JXA71_09490 [Chitinispirillaceae bacterium]|nr:hypothetical protein [Chitinispirillaceae bacterium]